MRTLLQNCSPLTLLLCLCTALYFSALAVQAQGGEDNGTGGSSIFSEIRQRIEGQIDSLIGELNQSLDDLLSDLRDFGDLVGECFDASLPGDDANRHRRLDISNRSLSFKSIISEYYQAFPNKSISRETISNLLDSTRDMTTRCSTRNRPQKPSNSSARYGFTSLSDKSVEEVSKMMGHETLPMEADSDQLVRRRRLSGSDERCQVGDRGRRGGQRDLPESFDWREQNVVTPVRNQRDCGSCWAFAALASLESALLITNSTDQTVDTLDLSEQQLLQCAKFLGSGCQGGSSYLAFSYLKRNGVTSEAALPYQAQDALCPMWRSFPDEVPPISDYCIRSRIRYTFLSATEQITEEDMRRTLVAMGPLYTAINANPLAARNYRGGVYEGADCTTAINHAVTLVGYTPEAWVLKNSWGRNWGEDGYFRLARGGNDNRCGIQTEIAWPLL